MQTFPAQSRIAHAGSVPYLKLWGLVAGAWELARSAKIAADRLQTGVGDPGFMRAKIATARFDAECLLPQADALAQSVVNGSVTVLALSADQF